MKQDLLIDLLLQRFEWVEEAFNKKLEKELDTHLSRTEIQFMSHLNDGKDRSSDMTKKLGITRQGVSLVVKQLESKNIIKLIQDPAKANAKLIKTTAHGRTFATRAIALFSEVELEIANKIGKKEFNYLKELLHKKWS